MAKTKSGDNYPLDIKGEMMFVGSIVASPVGKETATPGEFIVQLRLGYIAKLTQKRGVDVMVFYGIDVDGNIVKKKHRYENPSQQLIVVSDELLKTKDKLHEAIRFDARMAT